MTPEQQAAAEAKKKAERVFEEANKAALPDKIPARKDVK